MRTRTAIIQWVILGGLMLSQFAWAGRSLEQIEYALFKNPGALVEVDLRALVANGDLAAMRVLADMLGAGSSADQRERMDLYQAAFAKGRGEVRALASMARMMESDPYRREYYRSYFEQALSEYPHQRDVKTLLATLEVFLIYPRLFKAEAAKELIHLHRRSCVVDCATQLYEAVLAEQQGERSQADAFYRQAVRVDERAIERYYRFLGEQQNQRFPLFAKALVPDIATMSVESAHRIGILLDRIADLQRADERAAERKRQQHARATLTELEPKAPDYVAESDYLRKQSLFWVNHAAAKNWVPAMATRVYFMSSDPDNYSGAEAMRLIDDIGLRDPARAKLLRVGALMVTNWDTLDPVQAHKLIQQMIDEGHPDARLLLGDLYSRGGLDEPDQQRALAIFETEAKQGVAVAYFRQARIYASGVAICSDPPRAYALAEVALALGVERARGLMQELSFELTSEEMINVERIRAEIVRELKI